MPAALREYLALKQNVLSAADSLIRAGEEVRADLLPAQSARQRLEAEGLFSILVLGEFSRGKSTFINALIRAKLLPAAVTSCTATLNVIRGGARRGATILYRDESRPHRSLDLEIPEPDKALKTVVTKKGEDTQAIRRVELTWPGRLEETHVRIVDTPGVNDIDQQREEITYAELPNADAAILLLDCQQPFNGTERRFLTEKIIGNDIRKLFFVVNKIDQLSDPTQVARVLEHVRSEISQVEKNPRVFGVASKPWLASQVAGEVATGTGFPEFEEELFAFLAKASAAAKLRVPVQRLERFADALQSRLNEQRKRMLGDDTVRKQQLDRMRDEVRALTTARAEAERTLAVHGARLQAEVTAECQLAMDRLQQRGLAALRDTAKSADLRVDSARTVVNEESRNFVARLRTLETDGVVRLQRTLNTQVTTVMGSAISGSELSGITFDLGHESVTGGTRPDQKLGLLGGAGAGAAALGLLVGTNPIGLAVMVMGGLWMFLKNNGEQEEARVRQALERNFVASIEPFRAAANQQASDMVAGMVRNTRDGLRDALDSRVGATMRELEEMEDSGLTQAEQVRTRLRRMDELERDVQAAQSSLKAVALAIESL